jgi:hypothetical protein
LDFDRISVEFLNYKYMKKLLSAGIFLLAAFLGAGTRTNFYGDISIFLTIIIIVISIGFMHFAVELWKSDAKSKN